MTLSVPMFRVLFVAYVVSSSLVLAPSVAAQATAAKAAASASQAPASPFSGTVVEQRVAQVNDQIITLSDYERAEQQMDADAKQQGWTDPELAAQKHELLRDLIDKELLLSKGKELNITGETELVKRLDELRKQNHLDSMEDLEKAAQQQGVSYEDFKQKIRNEIIIQAVSRQEVARHIQLTKAEVKTYYLAHQAEFAQPEAVHLEEILVPVASDDAAAITAAQQKADEVVAKVKAGGDFNDLAKKESAGSTAASGGDFGDFKRGQLAKVFEDATFSLQPGQVTAPIRTKQGFIIFKVTQRSGGSSQDYAAIEPQVEEAAFMNRMQPAMRAYLTTLRTQAYIDIRSDAYQDAGGTGASVKPLYTAYTPPGQKKVKVKKAQMRSFRDTGRGGKPAASKPAAPASGAAAAAPSAAPGTDVAAATPPATPAPAATPTPSRSSSGTLSTKPVKKQKVRFGQAPRGTLDHSPTIAPAPAPAETQVASNTSTLPGAEGSAPAAKKERTRFSARRGKKVKGPTQDQLENQAQGTATPEEAAAQKTQAAPLGLNGDTAKKKKAVKVKSDQKTRYADKPAARSGEAKDASPQGGTPASPAGASSPAPASPADASSPADAGIPESGAPATSGAPSAATPDEKAPLDTTPTQPGQTAPAAPSTPQASPQ